MNGAEEICFGNGNCAPAYRDDGCDPAGLPAILGIQLGGPVIVVCGGADGFTDAALARAGEILGPGVAAAAAARRAIVVDGGTSSGVMQVVGDARARQPDAMPVLVGVAPAGG